MSETLLGVLIGGLIASITPIITLNVEYKKWKKTIKIERLYKRKRDLENKYKKVIEELSSSMAKNSYSCEMIADFKVTFPKEVGDNFDEMMGDKKKRTDDTTMKFHFFKITSAMKKSIKELENKIDKETN